MDKIRIRRGKPLCGHRHTFNPCRRLAQILVNAETKDGKLESFLLCYECGTIFCSAFVVHHLTHIYRVGCSKAAITEVTRYKRTQTKEL